jgi:hypothetical protein
METLKTTTNIRAELNNGYCYVRNLNEKGGVVDAMVSVRNENKVFEVINNITDETFDQVWSMLIEIKGIRFEYNKN